MTAILVPLALGTVCGGLVGAWAVLFIEALNRGQSR